MRKFSLTLHLWLGLIAALFLLVEGVTGGVIAWGPQFIRLLEPDAKPTQPTYHVTSAGPALPLSHLVPKLQPPEPKFHLQIIRFAPTAKDAGVADFDAFDGSRALAWFDPATGEILGTQTMTFHHPGLYKLTRWAGRFHGDFPAAVALLLMASTGLILWWPRRLFGLRRPLSLARTNFELHATIGFYASLLLFLFAGTGVMMGEQRLTLRVANWITHTPPIAPVMQQTHPTARPSAPLNLDQAFALARADRPTGQFTAVQWIGDNGLVAFQYRDATVSGRVMIDLRNGWLREYLERRVQSGPERFMRVMRQVHEGEIYGSPSRWIAGASGFLLAILAVTGPLIWYLRRRQSRTTPSERVEAGVSGS